jgi:GR25 family glycosyltransferase involved in LPS biosynthesis
MKEYKMPRVIGITVQRNQLRRDIFEAKHPDLSFEWYQGVDGAQIDRVALIQEGVLERDCSWSDNSIANALSHFHLWVESAERNQTILIFEDDAVFSQDFEKNLSSLISETPDGFDLLYLGFNWDSLVFIELFDSLAGIVKLTFSEAKLKANFDSVRQFTLRPVGLRLRAAFGTCGYLVTPEGARKLIQSTVPLSDRIINPPGVPWRMKAFTMDSLLNEIFYKTQSYVSFPPLVYVENNREASTIWNINQ